jgi:hypothetical protein
MSDAIALFEDGVEVSGRLLDGDPAAELVKGSTELDLLVLGSRGYGPCCWAASAARSRARVHGGTTSGQVQGREHCPRDAILVG